jgi:hypothetical protein
MPFAPSAGDTQFAEGLTARLDQLEHAAGEREQL